jgi:hypothetical protein
MVFAGLSDWMAGVGVVVDLWGQSMAELMFHLDMKVSIVAGVCYRYFGTRKDATAEPVAGGDGCDKTWPGLTPGS